MILYVPVKTKGLVCVPTTDKVMKLDSLKCWSWVKRTLTRTSDYEIQQYGDMCCSFSPELGTITPCVKISYTYTTMDSIVAKVKI